MKVKQLLEELLDKVDSSKRDKLKNVLRLLSDEALVDICLALLIYIRYGRQMLFWDDDCRKIYERCMDIIDDEYYLHKESFSECRIRIYGMD